MIKNPFKRNHTVSESDQTANTKKASKYRRELIEWAVLVTIGTLLYVTGLHTEVIGQIQRAVLATGIMQPEIEENAPKADYNLSLQALDGEYVSLADYKGKTIFINFWATWCPPCVAEMPDIESLYQKVGNEVAFVMISLDKEPYKAKNFIDKKGFEMPVYFLASNLPKIYNPSSIPTTYVISPAGEIVVTRHGMAKYDTKDFIAFLRSL